MAIVSSDRSLFNTSKAGDAAVDLSVQREPFKFGDCHGVNLVTGVAGRPRRGFAVG
jgi:hypothetical protein